MVFHFDYPYTPQVMCERRIRDMLTEERNDLEAQIFRKLTTRMRRRYAGQLMFVNAKNLAIVGFSTFWPFDHEQYRNVQMLCYRMPKVVGSSNPLLMWTVQDVVASE